MRHEVLGAGRRRKAGEVIRVGLREEAALERGPKKRPRVEPCVPPPPPPCGGQAEEWQVSLWAVAGGGRGAVFPLQVAQHRGGH